MAFDPLHELTMAGIDLTFAGAEQREIISSLGEEEVALLVSIQRRLQQDDPEVEAHIVGGLLF